MKEYKSSMSNWMKEEQKTHNHHPEKMHGASSGGSSMDKIQERRSIHGSPMSIKPSKKNK